MPSFHDPEATVVDAGSDAVRAGVSWPAVGAAGRIGGGRWVRKGGVVMVFRGEVLSVEEMLLRAHSDPVQAPRSSAGVLHTAASNAADCQGLLAGPSGLDEAWRLGILQTLDDYTSTLRRGGPALAQGVFVEEPALTGAVEVDAAFAALAEHLASRDGWDTPAWTQQRDRFLVVPWFPSVPSIFRAEAERESPEAFRRRRIFITDRSLARA